MPQLQKPNKERRTKGEHLGDLKVRGSENEPAVLLQPDPVPKWFTDFFSSQRILNLPPQVNEKLADPTWWAETKEVCGHLDKKTVAGRLKKLAERLNEHPEETRDDVDRWLETIREWLKQEEVALCKTFFNSVLLQRGAFEIRDEVFGGHREEDYWAMVANLLSGLEYWAKKVLKDNPRFIERENAIAVLRSVREIRKEFRLRKVQGGYILDGIERGVEQIYESRTVAKLMLETSLLITAAFRGDFRSKYWNHIERGVRVKAATKGTRKRDPGERRREITRLLKSEPGMKNISLWAKLSSLRAEWTEQGNPIRYTSFKTLAAKCRAAIKRNRI